MFIHLCVHEDLIVHTFNMLTKLDPSLCIPKKWSGDCELYIPLPIHKALARNLQQILTHLARNLVGSQAVYARFLQDVSEFAASF